MIEKLVTDLNKIIDHLGVELGSLHVGRANVAMVDDVQIHIASYGSAMPLKSVANISCPDAQTLRIEPWDKAVMGDLEKSLIAADVGNPQNMGEYLFLKVPPMTEERRRQVVKQVGEKTENAKISIRNVRQDLLKKIRNQKDGKEISEDEANRLEKQVQEKVDDANKKVEEISKKKEIDIMAI
ncbi:ribosome recycling factor [Candidatus Gracilibacteria bacterium]|nr:ribosome recycling factor [Candidatus Gracilibacteria bacterium]